jgi:glycosyltransferase involved in cell wall biosynthesis
MLCIGGDRRKAVEWMPVPSNLPDLVKREDATVLRHRLVSGLGSRLIGHFGTFGEFTTTSLLTIIPAVLISERRATIILIGKGGCDFVQVLQRNYPGAVGRVLATGALPLDKIPTYLAACHLLIQIYQDGISTRRGTAMAGLSCGLPIITTSGPATEEIWKTSRAVCLASSIEDIADRVSLLLDDQTTLDTLSAAALQLYQERFHRNRMVAAFRSDQP